MPYEQRKPFQFSLRTLMAVVTAIAVCIALVPMMLIVFLWYALHPTTWWDVIDWLSKPREEPPQS